jgi:hypothetical protein
VAATAADRTGARAPAPSLRAATATVAAWNLRGIATGANGELLHKLHQLRKDLRNLAANGRPIQIMFICETWLLGDDAPEIPGFTWFGRNRTNTFSDTNQRGSGGIGFLVANSIKDQVSIIKNPTYGNGEGFMWIRVRHSMAPSSQSDIYCGAYLENSRPGFPIDQLAALDELSADWKRLAQGAKNTFLLGDLNTRVGTGQETDMEIVKRKGETFVSPSPEERAKAANLLAFLGEHDLRIIHGRLCPAHATWEPQDKRTATSIIDYIATCKTSLKYIRQCGITTEFESDTDHNLLWATLSYSYSGGGLDYKPKAGKQDSQAWATRRLRESEITMRFREHLTQELESWVTDHRATLEDVNKMNNDDDFVNTAWMAWSKAMNVVALEQVGHKSSAPQGRKTQPWWNPTLTELCYTRGALKAAAKASSAKSSPAWQKFRSADKAVKVAARRAFRKWHADSMEKIESLQRTDTRSFWNGIKKLGGMAIASQAIECVRDLTGSLVYSADDVARVFCKNYSLIGTNSIPEGAQFDAAWRKYVEMRVETLRRQPVRQSDAKKTNRIITVEEIKAAIAKQKNKAPSPLDHITNDMLVAGGEAVIHSLAIMFNAVFDSGKSPTAWQTGIGCPCPKKGDLTDWSNYRIITLLSVVGKLFEIILDTRLSDHLESNGLLSQQQGGFRKGRSTADLTFTLTETIKARARKGQSTFACFLDIKKAYPSMHRATMLRKLAKAGVDGKLWRIISEMYTSTKTQIKVGDVLSDPYWVEVGLREGSVISPTLYSVFIDDVVSRLKLKLKNCGVTLGGIWLGILLYADDIVIMAESPEDLRRMLAVLERHADINQYAFSVPKYAPDGSIRAEGKTQVVVFGAHRPGYYGSWRMHGVRLQEVTSYTYLGLDLHWTLGMHKYSPRCSDGSTRNPFTEHVVKKLKKNEKVVHTLRRMQLGSGGFKTSTATQILRTMYDSSVNFGAEIWNAAAKSSWNICETAHAEAECRILGVSRLTNRSAVRAELGLLSQKGVRDAQSLGFLLRILKQDEARLSAQVYRFLLTDSIGAGFTANWARSCAPKILAAYGLETPPAVTPPKAWRKIVLAAIYKKEEEALCLECASSSKLSDYGALHSKIAAPAYLEARVPWHLESGRRLKTQLRLGTNMLQVEQGRHMGIPHHLRICPTCHDGVEDSFHFTMRCASLEPIRQQFFQMIDEIVKLEDCFGWAQMDLRARWEFILGDGVISGYYGWEQWCRIEHKVYSFLIKVKWHRLNQLMR